MLIRWTDMFGVADVSWFAYKDSQDPSLCHHLTTSGRIWQEIDRRCSLGYFKSDWGWPYTYCLGHVALIKPYAGICECAVSKRKDCSASSSSSMSLGTFLIDSANKVASRALKLSMRTIPQCSRDIRAPYRFNHVGTNYLLAYVEVAI